MYLKIQPTGTERNRNGTEMEPKWNQNIKKGTEMEPKLIKMEPKWNRNTKLDSISSANEVPHSYHLSKMPILGFRVLGCGAALKGPYSCFN